MDVPAPRLCRLSRPSSQDKFGFHLTGQKNKPGQCYISSVEKDSPAHYAGLKYGDKIVEVDGASVGLEIHQQVVARIAGADTGLSLLVADAACEEYHRDRDIVLTSNLPHVIEIRNGHVGEDIHRTVVTVHCDSVSGGDEDQAAAAADDDNVPDEVTDVNNNNNDKDVTCERRDEAASEDKPFFHLKIPIPSEQLVSPPRLRENSELTKHESDDDTDILVNLAKTAKEMREIIMRRKKKDPRKEKRKDIKRRVEMIEEL